MLSKITKNCLNAVTSNQIKKHIKYSSLILIILLTQGCVVYYYPPGSRHYPHSHRYCKSSPPISTGSIVGYQQYPFAVKRLIQQAQWLSKQRLGYRFGSAHPRYRGMDCSGTIYYLLHNAGVYDVPRSSEEMYRWVSRQGKLHVVRGRRFNYFEFAHLRPGDLLFWTGTYRTHRRITHVMMYLGKDRNGNHLMFGSTDGITYQGKLMKGVGTFYFILPMRYSSGRFVGYSCIPHLTCGR